MSITAYKVEANGHDRTGKDFNYVNIIDQNSAKKLRLCGRMRAFMDRLPLAVKWAILL